MKIGTITSTAATTAVDNDRRAVRQQSTTTSTSKVLDADDASAQVELSPEAAMLSQAAQDPAFDQAKVDRIAQAIRDGSFSVNPGAIADKLLANAQEVLGRSRPQH